MNTEELIQKAIKEKIISFNEDKTRITYLLQNKIRSYKTEEIVQAEAYLKLIYEYNYSKENIKLFVPVTMGADKREADIVVYKDLSHQAPYIVVECKTEKVSNAEYNQSINQAFSYAVSLGAEFVWATSGNNNKHYQLSKQYPQKHQSIGGIPKNYGQVQKYQYTKGGTKGTFDLKIVSQDELTTKFKQAHNALWGGGELDPSAAFDELDKLIFCKLIDEKKPRKQGDPYDFQFIQFEDEQKSINELEKRMHALYGIGRQKDKEVFREDIRLNPQRIQTVVGFLQDINLGKTDLDSKGRAFETFMDSFFRGNFGQYFTPREIVSFIVSVLPIKHNSLVLDTSCGSGGFLLHALDKVRKHADDYYPDFETNADERQDHYKYWHDFAEKNLFGIEINEQIARVAKMNMIIHDDGHTNVVSCDGLLSIDDLTTKDEKGNINTLQRGIKTRTNNSDLKHNHFDFIITNPPFGSTVKQIEQAYTDNYDVFHKEINWLEPNSKRVQRPNQSTEVLFIEQCFEFLRAGGFLAIVIPDGVLTNSTLQYVRDWIAEHFRIVAIISLPQTAFSATGAGVKSSVIFLRKYDDKTIENIQNNKTTLQEKIKEENNFNWELDIINQEKNRIIRNLEGFNKPNNLTNKAIKQTSEFKEWRTKINTQFRQQSDGLKEKLQQQYNEQKNLEDYDIFMAIADEIGYDATGKKIKTNELDFIKQELSRFISQLEGE
ncbi:Type I restriction-modification system, DNA-methyltransferase subunit M (EC 2.1.1.72) / Type I restriction-modification system, specificity subunit S [uncultured Gammaproteobacteria bacterium]|jgi:type I restriction enzyme M protein|nr:Type I restriction-modification system, DNA-methyltransferase subunit M (EC 2.1.1.72) / Type I restriction-modification system, specificity subunit S [uncultured Gammaproteobacteria bacterium]CAC9554014.1 Type I restriction-modification system, DNA-methyltransferase subunit M (EC 2.1.1.72) / Type I restriction-modification system, specificity subunit S [uncultured Gammaproteobacteria bacterium]CAC9560574.1 Type I restriction-modification system, DNA-methyltransferase subunit M (EC 2.1.1.72) / 